jgi:hypothetical protein
MILCGTAVELHWQQVTSYKFYASEAFPSERKLELHWQQGLGLLLLLELLSNSCYIQSAAIAASRTDSIKHQSTSHMCSKSTVAMPQCL